ncbi:MAG: M28 family peptidase [Bacteroidales bacterium]
MMLQLSLRNIIHLFILVLLASCSGNSSKNQESASRDQASIPVYIPNFNNDSAYAFIEKQLAFGPRVPGTPEHAKCAIWLENTLKIYIPDVMVQKTKVRTYNDKILDCKNIIASFKPERSDRVLLCAHWDTRPIADHDPDATKRDQPVMGANDGGSGVGVLLEIARQLSLEDPRIGVDIVLFDVEDYGQPEDHFPRKEDTWCLGSQYWSKNPHKPGYTARFGILLDMVGGVNATFFKEATSMFYAPSVVNMVWETAARAGYSDYFIDQAGGEVTDDHLYVNKYLKIPTIDIIQQDPSGQYSFFQHWHTTRDDMEHISKSTLEAVGKTVMTVLHQVKPPQS